MSEREIVSGAVQNLIHFAFLSMDKLVSDVKLIFPAVGVIVVVNNDDLDGAGVPRVTYKTLGKLTLVAHKTQSFSRGRLYSEALTGVSGSMDHVLCVVQDGYVTVKKNRLKFESQ